MTKDEASNGQGEVTVDEPTAPALDTGADTEWEQAATDESIDEEEGDDSSDDDDS
jgi:hypothetical protein